jgi:hypothetical protein
MEDNTLKALAENLAHQAVYGEPDPLVKAAFDMNDIQSHLSGVLSNPTARNALLGAGAGGLMGLLTADPETRARKALHYALLGGLGAGGLTFGTQMFGRAAAPPPKKLQAPIKSKLGPAAKGVGVGLGAAGLTAAATAAPIAAKKLMGSAALKPLVERLATSGAAPIAGQMAKNFGRLPMAGKVGIPAAGAALMYSLLNRGNN